MLVDDCLQTWTLILAVGFVYANARLCTERCAATGCCPSSKIPTLNLKEPK